LFPLFRNNNWFFALQGNILSGFIQEVILKGHGVIGNALEQRLQPLTLEVCLCPQTARPRFITPGEPLLELLSQIEVLLLTEHRPPQNRLKLIHEPRDRLGGLVLQVDLLFGCGARLCQAKSLFLFGVLLVALWDLDGREAVGVFVFSLGGLVGVRRHALVGLQNPPVLFAVLAGHLGCRDFGLGRNLGQGGFLGRRGLLVGQGGGGDGQGDFHFGTRALGGHIHVLVYLRLPFHSLDCERLVLVV